MRDSMSGESGRKLEEKSERASEAIQPVAGDLSRRKKTRQRKVVEDFGNHGDFAVVAIEKCATAAAAADIDAAHGWLGACLQQTLQHLAKIFGRAVGILPHENDVLTFADMIVDGK